MKAMRLADSGDSSALVEEDIPRPLPGRGEVLIKVYAVGVTSKELLWYPTTHDKNGTLTHIEAASVPISALTAWQGLFERAKLRPGEHVLVHGGAGGVGLFAIQLARFAGAQVTTTASSRNSEFVRQLGAERVIDYRAMPFEKQVTEVDVVFDTVGGETLRRSWSVLKPGGRMVTVAADSEAIIDERTKQGFFIVEANGEQLARIGRMLDAGELHTEVDAVLPLHRAAEAYAGTVKERRGRGKLVISVDA